MALNFGDALRAAQSGDPASVPDLVANVASGLGASDAVLYLVDFAQTTLEPLPNWAAHGELPHSEEVATTLAGRSFLEQRPLCAERPDGVRVWVPIVEGSDRTGVLAVTVAHGSDAILATCEELGLLAGYLIATHARNTDVYNLHRRRRSLTLAASMQWDLLPPLVLKTQRLSVAGLLEPAYEVGGDCFDFALNGDTFSIGVFDPLGHGVDSALMAALCVGCYRHDRREGHGLAPLHAHLDSVIGDTYPGGFVTGQLAAVNLESGEMTWTNAGHPLPMLIRGGRVIGEVRCPPSLPWGIGSLSPVRPRAAVASEALEPGDGILFYTDGVVEAHRPGEEPFGIDRLADLAGQQASDQLQPEEVVRRVVRAVLAHQGDELNDDATLVLFRWHGPGRR